MRAPYIRGLVHGAVMLAACFAAQAGQLADDPEAQWIPGLPIANSFAGIVDLDSDPSGAEATTSLGSGCRTPCSLEVTAEGPFTVTFTHAGHVSTTVQVKIQHARMGVSDRKFAPNPVVARLDPVPEPEPPPPKKTVATPRPHQVAPRKPVAAVQPAARPAPAPPAWLPELKPSVGVNANPIVPADAARSTAEPPKAAPTKPAAAAAQPPARPAPAPPAWPGEVKPITGIDAGPIVPRAAARSSDTPVARRWLDNFEKPASDQKPDK
jgi:hypothetical protein